MEPNAPEEDEMQIIDQVKWIWRTPDGDRVLCERPDPDKDWAACPEEHASELLTDEEAVDPRGRLIAE